MTRICIGLFGVLVALSGCSKDVQKTAPQSKGQRGESCRARNDCAYGLACVRGICSQNDFDIDVSARHCERIECEEDADCCGDKPLEAPARCANRVSVCETPTVEDCDPTTCTEDEECGDGVCGSGYCSLNGATCDEETPCAEDTCDTDGSFCLLSFSFCETDADCRENNCTNRVCDCDNPEYDPFDEICSDEECVDVCIYTCQDRLCKEDASCESDLDCRGLPTDICDAGRCVECLDDEDCDTDEEECVEGMCERPCRANEECRLFHECQDGDCEYVGCTSDRECVLSAYAEDPNWQGEPRLLRCLASDENPEIKRCRIPCENDAECAEPLQHETLADPLLRETPTMVSPGFHVCDTDGFCKFIGCTSDEECRAYLGLQRQVPTEDRPFVPTAICSDE
jgi:hypothetical protein